MSLTNNELRARATAFVADLSGYSEAMLAKAAKLRRKAAKARVDP